MSKRRVHDVVLPEYLSMLAADTEFGRCVEKLISAGLLSDRLLIPTDDHTEVVYRRMMAKVLQIKCENPEESDISYYPGDEIYCLNSGALFDASGYWNRQSRRSDVDNGVKAGFPVELKPRGAEVLLSAQVQNGDDHPWFPLSAMCSVTLVEHEFGDVDQVFEAFGIAYSAAEVLKAACLGTAAGAVGAAAAVGNLLLTLAIALDGEDELGTVVYRIDDILTGANRHELRHEDIAGSHLGNDYRYGVSVTFDTWDETGERPTFTVKGPHNLHTTNEWATAHFEIECEAQLRCIRWSAPHSTAQAAEGEVLYQGQRETSIRFEIPYGLYDVSVSAINDADGYCFCASHGVLFQYSSTGDSPTGNSAPKQTHPR
jgi:hypothetical protein